MKNLDAGAVHELADYPGLIDALKESHRSAMPQSDHLIQDDPTGGTNKFVTLVSWAANDLIVTKMVGIFPENLKLHQPSVQGLVAVFDATNGKARFVADGAAMTLRKTASDSALGSKLLSRPDSHTLLIVGAGGLAPHMIEAHCCVRPSIETILIWNRTQSRAESLAKSLDGTRDVQVVIDLDTAVQRADIICCVTSSDKPLVKGALLKPGAHLDLVGAYLPELREADDAAMVRGTVFVDTRNGMEGAGDLVQPVAKGLLGWDAVAADAFELCQDLHPGRAFKDEITIYKNVGAGYLDLFTARYLALRL